MDLNKYRESVKEYTDNFLWSQYNTCQELSEMCYANADDCYGDERDRWWEEAAEADAQVRILSQELKDRGLKQED